MRNRLYGGVRGRKTKVGRILSFSSYSILKDCEVAVGRFFQSSASLHPPFRRCRQGAAHKAAAGHTLSIFISIFCFMGDIFP